MSKAFNAGQPWTAELKAELKADYEAGMTLLELAEKYGRSGSSIVSQLEQAKLLMNWRGGHYYPTPETPWAMWQEVKDVDQKMKEATNRPVA
jgi:hypothetical protein